MAWLAASVNVEGDSITDQITSLVDIGLLSAADAQSIQYWVDVLSWGGGWPALFILGFLSVPPVLVYFSRKIRGRRKVYWIVITALFSWAAYIPLMILLRKKRI